MQKKNLLLSLLALAVPSFCLLSCDPALSSVSLSEDTLEGVEAEEAKFQDFSLFYVPERGGYLVGDYKGSLTSFAIPSQATGEDGITAPVVGLADYAFYGRKGITTVLLGDNVTYIGDYAFGDTEITDLRIDGKLTDLGEHAFDGFSPNYYEKDGIEYLPTFTKPYGTAFCDGTSVTDKLVKSWCNCVVKPGTTAIEDSAFEDCYYLRSVVIPSSVTSIGKEAFRGCSNLSSITIASSVTTIGDSAFYECTSLKNVVLPDSIRSLGTYAFYKCKYLESVKLPSILVEIPMYAFYGCESLVSIEIPSYVTRIEQHAFEWCTSLKSVTLPHSLKDIRNQCFYKCTSLSSIVIPSSVTNIASSAFRECDSLRVFCEAESEPESWQNVGVPVYWGAYHEKIDGIDYMFGSGDEGKSAFVRAADKDLEEVSFANLPDGYAVVAIEDSAFSSCSKLRSIDIPSSVSALGKNVFAGCSSMVSATFPSSLDHIPEGTFQDCSSLAEFEIPSSVIRIEANAFTGCSSLKSLPLPTSVTKIGEGAFRGCALLTSIEIPSGVYSIGKLSFAGCYALTSMTVDPENETYGNNSAGNAIILKKNGSLIFGCGATIIDSTVKFIHEYAFYDSPLTSIDLPSTVIEIGDYAFAENASLASINFPSGLHFIGDRAFEGCASLESIAIPAIMDWIGYKAFASCPSLSSITVDPDNAKYDSRDGCNAIVRTDRNEIETGCKNTIIPSSITSIYENAFYGCSSLQSIVIPSSVKTIYSDAFKGCSSLTIYCEVDKKPGNGYWESDWNPDDRPVVWGYSSAS